MLLIHAELISSKTFDLMTARGTTLRIKTRLRFHPGRQLEAARFLASCHFKPLLNCKQTGEVNFSNDAPVFRLGMRSGCGMKVLIMFCTTERVIPGYPVSFEMFALIS